MKKIKGMRKSVTIWLNSAAGSVIVALPIAETQLPAIKPYLGQNVFYYLSAIVVISNILLRFRTNKGLDEK